MERAANSDATTGVTKCDATNSGLKCIWPHVIFCNMLRLTWVTWPPREYRGRIHTRYSTLQLLVAWRSREAWRVMTRDYDNRSPVLSLCIPLPLTVFWALSPAFTHHAFFRVQPCLHIIFYFIHSTEPSHSLILLLKCATLHWNIMIIMPVSQSTVNKWVRASPRTGQGSYLQSQK